MHSQTFDLTDNLCESCSIFPLKEVLCFISTYKVTSTHNGSHWINALSPEWEFLFGVHSKFIWESDVSRRM